MEASEWLNQSKSEVFRKALFDYHAKVKENKCLPESGTDLSEWVFDHISLHRVLTCPYENCGDDFAKDLSPYCEEQSSEAQMGYRCEHFFDTNEIECPSCGRLIHISGVISEYPLGAYEYEQISVEKEACMMPENLYRMIAEEGKHPAKSRTHPGAISGVALDDKTNKLSGTLDFKPVAITHENECPQIQIECSPAVKLIEAVIYRAFDAFEYWYYMEVLTWFTDEFVPAAKNKAVTYLKRKFRKTTEENHNHRI